MFTGERDFSLPKIERACKELNHQGMQCELEVEEGCGHDYPSNFDVKLERAVSAILQS